MEPKLSKQGGFKLKALCILFINQTLKAVVLSSQGQLAPPCLEQVGGGDAEAGDAQQLGLRNRLL